MSHPLTHRNRSDLRFTRSFLTSHLEQYADGGRHAHHTDAHHRHLVPAANRLLLHHMADQLLLGGHLWREEGKRGITDSLN